MSPPSSNPLPSFDRIPNPQLNRRIQSRPNWEHESIPPSYNTTTHRVPNTYSSTQRVLPTSILPPVSRFLPQLMDSRVNNRPNNSQYHAPPPAQHQNISVQRNWNRQNNGASNAPPSNLPTRPPAPPQQHYSAQPSHTNAQVQNSSNRGSYVNGSSQSNPINQGPAGLVFSQYSATIITQLSAARVEIASLKARLNEVVAKHQADLVKLQTLERENNTLQDIRRTGEQLCQLRRERCEVFQAENTYLKNDKIVWSDCVQNASTSLKESFSDLQNTIEIYFKNIKGVNDDTSDNQHLFGGHRELIELNKVASQFRKYTQHITIVPYTGQQTLPQQTPPPPPLITRPVQNLEENQESSVETLLPASSPEQQEEIRLMYSDEEDPAATILQTNHFQLPAIASTSKQAAILDAQQNQTLNEQQQSGLAGQNEEIDYLDSDDCLTIDEGNGMCSPEQPVENENEDDNNEFDEPSTKKLKTSDEVVSTPVIEQELLEEVSNQSEILVDVEGSRVINYVEDGQVAGSSCGSGLVRELERNIASPELRSYFLCSCGYEVAVLGLGLEVLERHTHFDPVKNPLDVLKCRFCTSTFDEKGIYKNHLEAHGLKFFQE